MTSTIRRFGAIAQILSVLVFAVIAARVSPIYVAHEAACLTPTLELGASLESKVTPSHDALTNVVVLPVFEQISSSYSSTLDTSHPLTRRFQREILRR